MINSCGKSHLCTKCKKKYYCGDTEMDPICPQKYKAECDSCRFWKAVKQASHDAKKLPEWKRIYLTQLDNQS